MRRGPLAAAACAAGLFLLCAAALPAHPNARYYRGDVVAHSSWDGVIRLTGTVVVREGVTVTVEPGTEILVQPGIRTDIVVKGRLLVRGTPRKPVVFDTAGGCGAGPWGGIVFFRGSAGILENARVRCSARGIAGDLSAVTKTGVVLEPPAAAGR